MSYLHDTPTNIVELATLFRFETLAAHAWLRCEGQQYNNPTNPLNIRHSPTAIGHTAQDFAIFKNASAGLQAAKNLVYGEAPLYGYGAIVAQAGSHNAYTQARSIELSSWAAGHYGGNALRDGCLRRYVKSSAPTPAPDEVERMISAQVNERWHPTANAAGTSNGVLRAEPDRALPVVERIPLGDTIDTVAEIKTGATGHNGADGNWRLVKTSDRRVRFALRSDWVSEGFLP